MKYINYINNTMKTLTETEKAWITMMVQAYGMNEQTALSYIQNL
jgi:ribonucleotide reductase beta subunit family protein with ferritin-like domain